MQGEYTVDFAFDETVLLKPGYERAPAMRSGGSEWSSWSRTRRSASCCSTCCWTRRRPHHKHWRQDWVYEAPNRFEFSADQTWKVRSIPSAVNQGAWTQCVYEVSDAPRYCGTGTWTYTNNVPSWTSDLSWRPLPRVSTPSAATTTRWP